MKYKGYEIDGLDGYAFISLDGKEVNENFTNYADAKRWVDNNPVCLKNQRLHPTT